MVEFKLVISDPKSGATIQKEVKEDATKHFLGLKLGDSIKGEVIDIQGFEFTVTGGSDYCGFPMRKDVPGTGRKKILAYHGVGMKKGRKGMLQRKTVAGNTIHDKTAQINLKVTKLGSDDIFADAKKKRDESAEKKKLLREGKDPEAIKKEAEAKAAEAPAENAEAPAETKQDAKAPAEKAEAPKEDKPAEEKKAAPEKQAPKEEKAPEQPKEEKKEETPAEKPASKE